MTYSAALKELESLLEELRGPAVDLDALEKKVKRASELIVWCRQRLRKVEGSLGELDQFSSNELF